MRVEGLSFGEGRALLPSLTPWLSHHSLNFFAIDFLAHLWPPASVILKTEGGKRLATSLARVSAFSFPSTSACSETHLILAFRSSVVLFQLFNRLRVSTVTLRH